MKAETVAQILVNEIICRHSAPKTLLSDQGESFLAEVIKEMCQYFATNKINTTAYHPQTNGLTEKFNGTLCKMLSAYTNDRQTNWDIYLPEVLFAYRTSIQQTVKECPFRLLYCRDPRLPTDLDKFSPKSSFVENLANAWKEAKEHAKTSAKISKEGYDGKVSSRVFQEGQWVRLENPVTKVGLSKKLRREKFNGPYKVTKQSEKQTWR